MGSGNANRSGGLDRPSPAKVIAALDKFADWEPPDSPRAIAMREAAAVLRSFSARQPRGNPLDDPALAAVGYQTETDPETHSMRLALFAGRDYTKPLGYMVFTSDEAYGFAHDVLHGYDKLEGLVE